MASGIPSSRHDIEQGEQVVVGGSVPRRSVTRVEVVQAGEEQLDRFRLEDLLAPLLGKVAPAEHVLRAGYPHGGDREDPLPTDGQVLTAGREDPRARAMRQEVGDDAAARVAHLLAVVQHDEDPARAHERPY